LTNSRHPLSEFSKTSQIGNNKIDWRVQIEAIPGKADPGILD